MLKILKWLTLKKIKKVVFMIFNLKFINAYINFVFPLVELEKLLKTIPKIDVCIDVGSNKGQFALLLRKYFSKAKIYSFEPQPNLIKIQKKFLNNTKFFNLSLGDKSKKSILNITRRKDSSSLLEPKIKHPDFKIENRIPSKIEKLDNIIKLYDKKINLLKIDVQGYEYEVLKGSKNNLKKINFIIIELSSKPKYKNEVSKNKIKNFLKQRNFKLKKIYNKGYIGDLWQADFLFERIERQ